MRTSIERLMSRPFGAGLAADDAISTSQVIRGRMSGVGSGAAFGPAAGVAC